MQRTVLCEYVVVRGSVCVCVCPCPVSFRYVHPIIDQTPSQMVIKTKGRGLSPPTEEEKRY